MKKTIILIPHYNNSKALINSIQSIGIDEVVDILIVDDGSEKEVIEENKILNIVHKNIKVFFIYLKRNLGIEYALNEGLKWIISKNYKYIARLDCGDFCVNNRFLIQEGFMEKNNDIHFIGSFSEAIDKNNRSLFTLTPPTTHSEIKKKMYLGNLFIHPSVFFRTSIIKEIGYYPTNYEAAEDYAYFFKIVRKLQTSNINQVLVKFVIEENGISALKRRVQINNRVKIIWDNFYFGYWPILGLTKNILIMLIPYKVLIFLKRMLKNKIDYENCI